MENSRILWTRRLNSCVVWTGWSVEPLTSLSLLPHPPTVPVAPTPAPAPMCFRPPVPPAAHPSSTFQCCRTFHLSTASRTLRHGVCRPHAIVPPPPGPNSPGPFPATPHLSLFNCTLSQQIVHFSTVSTIEDFAMCAASHPIPLHFAISRHHLHNCGISSRFLTLLRHSRSTSSGTAHTQLCARM